MPDTQFSLIEKPNTSALGWIAQHPEVYSDQVEKYRNYADACLQSSGELKVEYIRKGLGRFFPRDPPNCFPCTLMWRNIRSTLFHEKHIDLDIINCHPRIARELLIRAQIPVPETLDMYCTDREKWLASQRLTKDQAKALFCALLNGGKLRSQKIWADKGIPSTWQPCEMWVKTEIDVLHAITELFQRDATKVLLGHIAEADPNREDTTKRIDISCQRQAMSHVYLYYETEHMIKVMAHLQSLGVVLSAYCYDGCVIEKRYQSVVEKWIAEGCIVDEGWSSVLQFKIKPFGEVLEEPKYDFSDAEFMRLAKPETLDEAGCKAVLPKLKVYFERFWCLVDESQELVKQMAPGEYLRFKNGTSQTATAALQYPVWIREGKEGGRVGFKPWLPYWMKDCTKRKVGGWDYAPPPRVCKPNHLDLWTPFSISKYPQSPIAIDTSIIKNHIKFICEDSQEGLDYVLKWLAFIMQKPGIPTGACLIFIGDPGSGKSEMWKHLMEGLMGEEHIHEGHEWNLVFGKFNVRAKKSFILCDEMDGFDSHRGAGAMKAAITETTCNCEKKGKDSIKIPAACNYIIASNSEGNIVNIEKKDRRYSMFRTPPSKEKWYYKELFTAIADKTIIRAFYDELMAIDIVGFDTQDDRIITESYKDLQEENISKEDRFFADWKQGVLPTKPHGSGEWVSPISVPGSFSPHAIYEEYRYWCEKVWHCNNDQIKKPNSFYKHIKRFSDTEEHLVKTSGKKSPVAYVLSEGFVVNLEGEAE